MSNTWNQKKFNEIVAEIQKKSVTDPEFRARALADAGAAVTEVSGESLPPGAKLRFVTQLEEVVIVLPPAAGDELSEAQLESVAGGFGFIGIVIDVTIKEC